MLCNYCMIWYVGKSVQNVCASEVKGNIMKNHELSQTISNFPTAPQMRHNMPFTEGTTCPLDFFSSRRPEKTSAFLRGTVVDDRRLLRLQSGPLGSGREGACNCSSHGMPGRLSAGSAMRLTNSAERPVASVVHAPTSTSPRKRHRKRPLVVII